MVNVNGIYDQDYLGELSRAIWMGLYDAGFNDSALAAQIAVNIKDYVDSDSDVTSYYGYYGFESPCIYISELVYKSVTDTASNPPTVHRSYAIELYKPYSEDVVAASGLWRLSIDGAIIDIDSWPQGKGFYVVQNQDEAAKITVDANAVVMNSSSLVFSQSGKVELQRKVDEPNETYIVVESIYVPDGLVPEQDGEWAYQRDITKHKCIRRLWCPVADPNASTLGSKNSYVDMARKELIQAHPANRPFTNIGEIGMVLQKSAYSQTANPIGPGDTEYSARLNLENPKFQQIFKYLALYRWPQDETRTKGRININTAPWFVIAQLPWITHPVDPDDPNTITENLNRYNLAKAIVAYRDKDMVFNYDDPGDLAVDYANRTTATGLTDLNGLPIPLREELGFETIGELATVVNGADAVSDVFRSFSMRYYMDGDDQRGFPDLTMGDGAADDFEERDLIFSRISNLVTVRSDVFTAYILVRIGADGPQKRVLAVFDRSRVTSPEHKVGIVALNPVPDPR